jgi:hypothetical protein
LGSHTKSLSSNHFDGELKKKYLDILHNRKYLRKSMIQHYKVSKKTRKKRRKVSPTGVIYSWPQIMYCLGANSFLIILSSFLIPSHFFILILPSFIITLLIPHSFSFFILILPSFTILSSFFVYILIFHTLLISSFSAYSVYSSHS